ncbi:MAG: aromatic ring-hydroxylating dioxygenase subunit alpha [Parasphingopyxis sp.]|nr:aromatic ring-hydroxylating dioxygenase subunit alpha [Sphingomonadales bacterium]
MATRPTPDIAPDGEADRSLPAWTYRDADFLDLEREHVFRPAWHLVCHANDIPEPGDWRSFALLGELAIVVRGRDGAIRGFHNVCRHRAARLLDGEGGHCPGRITCSYHGWSYGLDGALTGVPFEADYPDFDRADHGLAAIECDRFAGFVFIRLESGGSSLADYLAPVAEEMALYRFAEMEPLIPVRSRIREINWKNGTDNYVDALHIRIAHPGLNNLVHDSYRLTIEDGADKIFADIDAPGRGTPSVAAYRALLPEADHLPPDRQRLWSYWKLWPALMFDVYPDQVDFMQFIPVSPTRSILRDAAYALPDSRREMRAARYLNQRINRQVNREDTDLIERVQAGMGSSSFADGPLGRSEIGLRHFAERMRAAIPAARHAVKPSFADR